MANFTVSLESPAGSPIPSNELIPGELLHISCQSIWNAGFTYSLTFEPISPKNAFATIQDGGTGNIAGNWETDLIVPTVIATAHLKITVSPSVGANEVNVYLGIGELPPPIPNTDLIQQLIKVIAIGGGAVIGIMALSAVMNRKK